MKEQLIHILDQSVCLSRKQMKEYLSGTMQQEEMHAAEIHLNTCPLCSMAMEGFEAHSEEALEAVSERVVRRRKDMLERIRQLLDDEADAPAAAQQVRALMFIERFAQDVESRLAQLGQ